MTATGAGGPKPPPFIASDDGEFIAALGETVDDAVATARDYLDDFFEPDEPKQVELTPVAGHPGWDEYWTTDVDATAKGLADEGEPVKLKVLGPPVTYWRLRDAC